MLITARVKVSFGQSYSQCVIVTMDTCRTYSTKEAGWVVLYSGGLLKAGGRN